MPDYRHDNSNRPPNRTGGSHPERRSSPGGERRERDEPTIDTTRIVFDPLSADLFNSIAKRAAETIAGNRNANKPSQIRKFYDELSLWDTKTNLEPARFSDYLPFILMLNAKAAYAKGRRLVDANFVKLIEDCLRQVKDSEKLRLCKLFFEAFLGFYKELRPSDK